jgi:NarL family two-component system response regulator LiaR
MSKIRVLLVDDHALFREGLRFLLEDQEEEEIEVVGEAEDGLEAVRQVSKLKPNLVLMDINMPILDGVEATRLILKNDESVGIIILTMYPQDEYVIEALKAGAKAYILKDTRSKELLEVIKAVHKGQAVIDPQMTTRLLDELRQMSRKQERHPPLQTLTDRERRILTLLAAGASNKDIAVELELSERTVKNYLSVIFQKLQVNNRTEAAIRAMRDGLLNK